MAGPAIRAWNMAEVLSVHHEVRLISTVSASRTSSVFDVRHATRDSVAFDAQWADVIVLHPGIIRTHPAVASAGIPIVVDIYDPFHLENLEATGGSFAAREENLAHLTSVINDSLLLGDFFVCASERQRDFWLGSLAALGRVNPSNYDVDATLRHLVGVVPFGIPTDPPKRRRDVLRGVVPGIGPSDQVLIWGGGVYNWFDPVTLVEAVAMARDDLSDLRLVFLGMTHPNRDLPPMRVASETRQRSEELGLTDRYVFFNEGWVPYDERDDYLLEADVGISTHRAHIETTYSFRTRMLDYLWAGLPIITSEGDLFADLAVSERIGEAVPPEDTKALALAIVRIFSDSAWRTECATNARRVAERFHWPAALEPLTDFCASPTRAADLLLGERHEALAAEPSPPLSGPEPPAPLLRRARRRFGR